MKTPSVHTYLSFGGRCEEAVAFYVEALGAKVEMTMKYKDSPEPMPAGMLPPGFEEKVMHTSFRIGETVVMASDGCGGGNGDAGGFKGFSLSITVGSETEARRYWDALTDGGTVQMPLGKTFWSPCFGMLTDRFGLGWMISMEPATA